MDAQQSFTQAQAAALAQKYGVIVGRPGEFTPYLSAMHAANPQVRVLQYQNGTYAKAAAYPMSTYDLTATGTPAVDLTYHTWLVNPTPAWAQVEQSTCQANVAAGYDGCFVDTLGQMNAGRVSLLSGTPVNPATGQPWVDSNWMQAMDQEAADVAASVPGKLVADNGVANGLQYFDPTGPTSGLIGSGSASLGMSEQFVRAAGTPVTTYPPAKVWITNVQMLADAEARGDGILAITKLWVPATQAQQNAWHKFALATFLLGAGSHSYFNFTASSTAVGGVTTPGAYDHVAIGTPTGPFAAVGYAYQRPYSNGLVVVNPSKNPVVLSLSRSYRTLDGLVVSGSITLQPDTGDVLVNA